MATTPPFSLLDQSDGFAKAGMGQVAALAGRSQPWLYMFEVYSGNQKQAGTIRGDYDILWLDRGTVPGKTVPWIIRRRGTLTKTLGGLNLANSDIPLLPYDLFDSVRVPVRSGRSDITTQHSREFSVGFASKAGLLAMQIGSWAKESVSPFVTSWVWYPKDVVEKLPVTTVDGQPVAMLPNDKDPVPGSTGYQLINLSNKMALG
jgi:hypothetical protein